MRLLWCLLFCAAAACAEDGNTKHGNGALQNVTPYPGGASLGIANTAIGFGSMQYLTTGFQNTAIGLLSLWRCTTCTSMVAIGEQVLQNHLTGTGNGGIGYQALNSNADGEYNFAAGHQSLWSNLHGSRNVSLGAYAGWWEMGSDSFYVNNRLRSSSSADKTESLMYGTFDATPANQTLTVNAKLKAAFGVALPNTSTPATDSDGHLFVNGGALYYKSPGGTVTMIAPN